MRAALRAYRNFRPFTDEEAWMLFKLAAFGEAIGWTLLITGIILTDYVFGGNRIPVTLAGRTHGMLFLLYITAVLVLSPSLGWSWTKTFIAGLFSVPPYGTIIFEFWENRQRKHRELKTFSRFMVYRLIRAS
jgi:integral membrane protein